MDHTLSDATVPQFRLAMLRAADAVHIVSPAELREPLALWFVSTEERCRIENWRSLLGRQVVAVWNAAHAVIDARGRLD